MESMNDCLRQESTKMCPGKAARMRSLKDMNCARVHLGRMCRQRNQMTNASSQASWQDVCIGDAHSEVWAWRHARASQLDWASWQAVCIGEAHSEVWAWRHARASQLVEAPVICLEWHLLSLALLAQVPDHWKLHRPHQAASPWQLFCAAEGEEHLDAGRQLDCC